MDFERNNDLTMGLRSFYDTSGREQLWNRLRHWIEDPLRFEADFHDLRINPILIGLLALLGLGSGTFLVFSWIS